ncbi:MAG: Transposase [Deltaproteobacteria bacterium ADurb.Bin135]|nr:MAG: Transposase [Deltaproteobacteria bacterium ADurb.Bin135]
MNNLIPFKYQGLATTEAVISLGPLPLLKRFRMTRKGWGEFFGAKNPQAYMDILKHRFPDLPDGIPVTVTVNERGELGRKRKYIDLSQRKVNILNDDREFVYNVSDETSPGVTVTPGETPLYSLRAREITVITHDIFEAHQYAVYSVLPNARKFLLTFPAFQQAIVEGRVALPDPTLAEIAAMPKWTHGRGALLKDASEKEGVSSETVRRWANKIAAGVPLGRHVTPYIHSRYRDVYEKAVKLIQDGGRVEDIAKELDIPVSTLYRWKIKDKKVV